MTQENMGLRARQRQARGEAILCAAFDLMAEQGYDALTMEALAERVGISRQTLYHHFASKEDIALRAVLTLMEQGTRSIQALDPALPPITRLERVIRWMLELRFSPNGAAFVKARPALVPIKARPEYRRAFERRAAAITEIVDAAQQAGEIDVKLPGGLIVQMLLGLVVGAEYEELVASGEVSSADITERVVSVFFRGIQ